jgi:hypothetical protein
MLDSSNYLLCLSTLNGLASAAAYGSKLNRVVRYNPMNLTALSANPPALVPVPKPPSHDCPLLTGLLPVELEPSVYPLDWKLALCFAGPLPASDDAWETALRSAAGLAPRMVSFTEPFLKTKKVGMLWFTS